jgi:hypothetical protein
VPPAVGLPVGAPRYLERGVEPLPDYLRATARVNAVIVGGQPPAGALSRCEGRCWPRSFAARPLPVRRR